MIGNHPNELRLARLSDDIATENASNHLRWCARCRRTLADYRWLEGEVTTALEAEAAAAPVPRADWAAVSSRLGESAGQTPRRRLAFAVTAALVACMLVAAPSLFGRQVQAQPIGTEGVSSAPHPVEVGAMEGRGGDGSPLGRASADPGAMVTLPFVPPPTPPDSDI